MGCELSVPLGRTLRCTPLPVHRFWNVLLLLAAAVSAAAVLVIMKLPVRALPPAAQRYAMHVRSTQQRAGVGGGAALLIMGLTGTLTTLLWILLVGFVCTW